MENKPPHFMARKETCRFFKQNSSFDWSNNSMQTTFTSQNYYIKIKEVWLLEKNYKKWKKKKTKMQKMYFWRYNEGAAYA